MPDSRWCITFSEHASSVERLQTVLHASSETEARNVFRKIHPDRHIVKVELTK